MGVFRSNPYVDHFVDTDDQDMDNVKILLFVVTGSVMNLVTLFVFLSF